MRARAGLSALAPLFLVSLATVGYEIALTRTFAVAKWSEYGYWVISIVLAGFALSGVVMALARDRFARHGAAWLAWLPVGLIAAAALGYHLVAINPFNPLQLQNPATFADQLWNIAGYYAGLLPFFFLSGLYISLCFVLNDQDVGRVYGFDLTGAGMGALATLGLMALVHPFRLVPCLLLPLAAAALFARVRRRAVLGAALAALLGGEALLLFGAHAQFNDFKAIYAPLHVPDSQVVSQITSPRGLYMLLDDFTERVDTDISNNAGMLGLSGPPETFGLYRDGNRLAALPKAAAEAPYAGATLAALPYELRPHGRVLLAGASGGFRIAEARALGAADILALEPEPVLRGALRQGLGPSPAVAGAAISQVSPIAASRAGGGWDIIDIAPDFLDAAEANASAFAAEAIATYLQALAPGGIISIPVSIREFPAYAVRVLATVRQGLLRAGITDVPAHVLVYRSAWNVRVLVSNAPFDAGRIAVAKRFCDDRSFDISYYPGIDVVAARASIYNDLPAVSFEAGEVTSGDGPHDAIADEALAVLRGDPTASGAAFNLAPITYDRPSFYAVLRLSQLGTILNRLEILPQAEIGPLVNLAVLAQAVVIALLVLAVPLLGGRRFRDAGTERVGAARAALYFATLGLGFLAIEIFLIERASFYLNDRTTAFALVLTGMLIFSGLGSMLAGRFAGRERLGVAIAGGVVLAWCAALLLGLQDFMLATLDLPFAARAAVVLALLAPASVALGLPFPLGLSRMGHGGFLPWAWGLNGAFSVVATPLANLIAITSGYDRVLLLALLLYAVAVVSCPSSRQKDLQWSPSAVP
ncbi:conserved membrane protein of unknown function [Rhodovastum atsumiense]|uniref:Spermidine synthase n=1 Tax=Rhodovastum atsumiense TaxID=504468 RepID=A0A5M6INA5_9PROT|nr:hypothetical protein [Rhodovastum atsumiense]KAA5609038.1 hypothetical protein F1189_26165 [Rhodovastum atsumiense]CAH2604677.1 conserved membrane protein of unknown function [Rhodovastum atsumiense]